MGSKFPFPSFDLGHQEKCESVKVQIYHIHHTHICPCVYRLINKCMFIFINTYIVRDNFVSGI
jgi:hypothetical protein